MDIQHASSPATELLTLAMHKALVCKFRIEGSSGRTAVKLSLGSDDYQVTWSSSVSPNSTVHFAIEQVSQSALSYLARMTERPESSIASDLF